jgi:hypothetical protein
MRLQDVVAPYLDGVSVVVESHKGSLSMEPYLGLPAGVRYERRPSGGNADLATEPSGLVGGRALELAMFGPDLDRHGPEVDALATIRNLRPGGRCLVLIGYETHAMPFHRLLDALTAAQAQVVQITALEYTHIHAAAMVTATARLAIPRDPVGEPLSAELVSGGENQVLRRIANEFEFTDFVFRNLRALIHEGGATIEQMVHAERDLVSTRAELDAARADLERASAEAELSTADAEQSRAEADRSRAELGRFKADAAAARAEAEQTRIEAEAELDRITRSTSYQLGRTLIGITTGRQPVTGLPRALVRLWRGRGGHRRHPAIEGQSPSAHTGRLSSVAAPAPSGGPAPRVVSPSRLTARGDDRFFLADSSVAISARSRPVVVGILGDATAGALAEDAIVNRITPNDALLTLERSEPDLVMVEAAAFAPSHPWAYAVDAAAVDRASVLLDLLEQARGMGRPTVLVRSDRSADHAGLVPLEPRFDLVLDVSGSADGAPGWTRGIQLARFNPLGGPTVRDKRPLLVGGLDQRASVWERRFLEPVLAVARERGLVVVHAADDGPVSRDDDDPERLAWCDLAALYRRTACVIANPFTERYRVATVPARTLEQLASGARVISGPNQALVAAAGQFVTLVQDPAVASERIASALEAGPTSSSQMRHLLRTLFQRHASPVMLSMITRKLGLPTDPLSRRSVTALVSLDGDADVESVVGSLTRQVHLPTRTVIRLAGGASWPDRAHDALEKAGVAVRVIPADHRLTPPVFEDDPRIEWLARWPDRGRAGPTYLLDLVIGGEMSRAEVIGHRAGEPFRFVSKLELDSTIVRRNALVDVGGWPTFVDPDQKDRIDWTRHGWRFLSVGPQEVT